MQGAASVPLVAETGDPVPESQLKPAHSNYVPAQVYVPESGWKLLRLIRFHADGKAHRVS